MSSIGANLNLEISNNQNLLDSKINDITFNTYSSSQNILFGCGSNNYSQLKYSKFIITSNNIGINTINPRVSLDINSTDALKIPIGTTLQRPTGSNGYIRYNTTILQYEGYVNNNWRNLSVYNCFSNLETKITAEDYSYSNNDQ
jgi:hypothetical protein